MKKAIICAFLGLNLSTAMGKFESGFGQRENHFEHGLEQLNNRTGLEHGDKLEVLRGNQRFNIDGPRDLKSLFQQHGEQQQRGGERRERSEGNQPQRRERSSEGWNRRQER